MGEEPASIISRNITFRLYPNLRQQAVLEEWLGLHRELYNAALQERRDAYSKKGISLTFFDQKKELPAIKKVRPDLIPLGAHALSGTLRRLDRAFNAFFRRVKKGEIAGYPRFKGRNRFDSFTYSDKDCWKILELKNHKGSLRLTNLGIIKMRGKPRVAFMDGDPRCLTIKKSNGKWHAVVTVRYNLEVLKRSFAEKNTAVGIDPGSYYIATLSTGEKIKAPRFLEKTICKLKHNDRELSRKKIGSSNREKARRKANRLHEKVKCQRKDFLHKLSAQLVTMFAFIAIEKMQVTEIVKNCGRRKAVFNRNMLDAGITTFIAMLAYKAEEAGGQVVMVEARNTSRICSGCNIEVPKALSNRIHHCKACGLIMDRDINAAINISALGLIQNGRGPSECGGLAIASL